MIDNDATMRTALLAGIAAGVIFLIVPTIEIFRRPGFDIERHAISMLSLGEGGWIMKLVFILCGLLTITCAWGAYQAIGGRLAGNAAAALIAVYGIGLVLAGLFDAPAGLGFPAGTPIDQQPVMSRSAILHSLAFMIAFGSLILSCFAFACHFAGQGHGLVALLSLATGLAMPALIYLGISTTLAPGIAFYWAAMAGWAWLGTSLFMLRQG